MNKYKNLRNGCLKRERRRKQRTEAQRARILQQRLLAEFDTPVYFGEDGDLLAVRGDITRAEAFQRICDDERKLIGDERPMFGWISENEVPGSLRHVACVWCEYGTPPHTEEDWILNVTGKMPPEAKPGAKTVSVWALYVA